MLWYGLAAVLAVLAVLAVAIMAAGLWLFKRPANEAAELPPAAAAVAPAIPAAEPPAVVDKPAAAEPVLLDGAEAENLIARLQTGPQPASCRAGTAKLRQDNKLTASQASAIAKRAWPDICSPPKPAVAAPASQPVAVSAPPAVENKSIDQLYNERSARECATGLSGFICREGLRNKLCTGKWSSSPPPGQSTCYLPSNNNN